MDDEERQSLTAAVAGGGEGGSEVSLPSVLLYVTVLTLVEVGGTFLLTRFAYDDSALASLAAGVVSFALLGLTLGFAIRAVQCMSVVNALWQSASIFALTLLSVFHFHEPISRRQVAGVALATAAAACFTR